MVLYQHHEQVALSVLEFADAYKLYDFPSDVPIPILPAATFFLIFFDFIPKSIILYSG